MARLGWQMDEKTQTRYETGKQEEYIAAMDDFHRGYETEEIFHEEDPLRVLRRLEGEGWMKHLFPALSAAKANVAELERLRESQTQLELQGIHPDPAVANFPMLTGKLSPKDVAALKKSFPRQGFVQEIEALESEAKAFAGEFSGKGAASPSQAWKLLHGAKPESVLWVAHTSKNVGIQGKFKGFFTEWAQARQRLPYTLMQEMRIVPELPGYEELLDKLFFELMDSRLGTAEEMKAFLEPYSPPAPPPPVHLRRPRVAKKDAKPAKSRKKAPVEDGEDVSEGVPAAAETAAGERPAATPVAARPVKAPVAPQASVAAKAAPVAAKANGTAAAKKTAAKNPAAAKHAAKAAPKKAASVPVAKKTMAKPSAKAPAKKTAKAPMKKPLAKSAGKKAPLKAVAKKTAAKAASKKAAPVKRPAAAKKAVPTKKTATKPAVKKTARKKGR